MAYNNQYLNHHALVDSLHAKNRMLSSLLPAAHDLIALYCACHVVQLLPVTVQCTVHGCASQQVPLCQAGMHTTRFDGTLVPDGDVNHTDSDSQTKVLAGQIIPLVSTDTTHISG